MKKLLVLLMAVFLCSLSAWCRPSVATIGVAVTRSNDFAHAKTMLTNDGLVYDSKSTSDHAIFKIANSAYADEVLIVEVFKKKNSKKVEKCVITFGDKYLGNLDTDLRRLGYSSETYGLSVDPYQMLYNNEQYAMGFKLNEKGWCEATFFRYDQ